MPIDMEVVKQAFFEESEENLDMMESGLLDLELKAIDTELINAIFRAAHSMKGGAGIFDYTKLIDLSHLLETLLDAIRRKQYTVTQSVIDMLLQGVDALRMLLDVYKLDKPVDQALLDRCQAGLEAALSSEHMGAVIAEPAVVLPNAGTEKIPATAAATKGWQIFFDPAPELLKSGNDPIKLFRELSCLGTLVSQPVLTTLPSLDNLQVDVCYLSWLLILQTDADYGTVYQIFEWVEAYSNALIIEPWAAEKTATATFTSDDLITEQGVSPFSLSADKTPDETGKTRAIPVTAPEAGGDAIDPALPPENHQRPFFQESNSIRVNIEKVDALINLIGELVITQSILEQIGRTLDTDGMEELHEGLSQLARNTRELQENVMRVRMLPVSFVFNRFPRLVHDLAQQLGKKVELKLSGEQTELDKTILEKISEPLLHLVRNAMDHGIEPPDVRRAAGKPATGQIMLHAFHQGGHIIIQVSDDGAGIDLKRVLQRARDINLVGETEEPSAEQLADFIFYPGFSTALQVSDVSGRGVGMDVVRRNIRMLGGRIDIHCVAGEGTLFSIRLPLTLSILDGQLVRVGKEIYVLPLLSIIKSVRIETRLINLVNGHLEVYHYCGEYIPIFRLYQFFQIEMAETDLEKGLLVILEGDGQRIGLFIDELLEQQQIVIKSLETNYRHLAGLSGATILGSGHVALILDVVGLLQLGKQYVNHV